MQAFLFSRISFGGTNNIIYILQQRLFQFSFSGIKANINQNPNKYLLILSVSTNIRKIITKNSKKLLPKFGIIPGYISQSIWDDPNVSINFTESGGRYGDRAGFKVSARIEGSTGNRTA